MLSFVEVLIKDGFEDKVLRVTKRWNGYETIICVDSVQKTTHFTEDKQKLFCYGEICLKFLEFN
jgi:hypothetical protein